MKQDDPNNELVQNHDLNDQELNEFIRELCVSKAEEFQLLGYEHVTGEDVWSCVSEPYEKHGIPLLHQIVNDILSLKVVKFMNWMTIHAYKNDEIEDIADLL